MIPDVGLRLVMLGAGTVTVKLTPLLATPPTVTTTFPVVAPLGTGGGAAVPAGPSGLPREGRAPLTAAERAPPRRAA